MATQQGPQEPSEAGRHKEGFSLEPSEGAHGPAWLILLPPEPDGTILMFSAAKPLDLLGKLSAKILKSEVRGRAEKRPTQRVTLSVEDIDSLIYCPHPLPRTSPTYRTQNPCSVDSGPFRFTVCLVHRP